MQKLDEDVDSGIGEFSKEVCEAIEVEMRVDNR
jgi:hypothetical protein